MAVPPNIRMRTIERRDSALRASIFDTALELGVGSGSAVADWIFNPVEEGEEDAENPPGLMYAWTATSEESSHPPSASSHGAQPGAANVDFLYPQAKGINGFNNLGFGSVQGAHLDDILSRNLSPEPSSHRTIHFDLSTTPEPRVPSPIPPTPKHRKLRKPRPDGYESDGGYVSDGGKADRLKKDKSKKGQKEKGSANAFEHDNDGGYFSDVLSRRRRKKQGKSSFSGSPVADYDTDGGYMPSASAVRNKKNRQSKHERASPTLEEESDGAYLSESSKKRRFFRLKSSRKRQESEDLPQEVVPPVPSLPPMPLPIAERFARSEFSIDSSRTSTPLPSEPVSAFLESETSSISEVITVPAVFVNLPSPHGLTSAFKDAESVRSPSLDVLRTYGPPPHLAALHSPSPSMHPQGFPLSPLRNMQMPPPVPSLPVVPVLTLGMPKPKRNLSMKKTPPHISTPNTRSLTVKPQMIPLTLTPPSPSTGSTGSLQADLPPSPATSITPSTDYIVPSPTLSPSPLPSPVIPPSPIGLVRPKGFAHYDLPPASPPPVGPLPQIPVVQHSPLAHSELPSPARSWEPRVRRPGTADSVNSQKPPRPLMWKTKTVPSSAPPLQSPPSPYRSPIRAGTAPVRTPSPQGTPPSPASAPLFLKRIPSKQQLQRGRESPFPVHPVLPKEESSGLMRQISVARPPSRTSRDSNNAPMSAGAFSRPSREQLDIHWQPRSASVLDGRSDDSHTSYDHQSWTDYEDTTHDTCHTSTMADVESVLSVFKQEQEEYTDEDYITSLYADRSGEENDTDEASHPVRRSHDRNMGGLSSFVEMGGDTDDDGDYRYSVWSSRSRSSFIDKERSGITRAKLLRNAESFNRDTSPGPGVQSMPKLSSPQRGSR